MKNNLVGVIGGMGPLATVKFMEFIIDNTDASKDQENVEMLVCQYSSIPDRTSYILDNNNPDPRNKIISAAKLLENNNCSFIVIPCNTSMYFYEDIKKSVNIPVINIVKETIDYTKKNQVNRVGILATNGTIKTNVYEQYNDGLDLFYPNNDIQKEIMSIIYDYVKKNNIPPIEKVMNIIDYFKNNQCEKIILGCTELSVAFNNLNLKEEYIVDSLTVLARKTIILAENKIKA